MKKWLKWCVRHWPWPLTQNEKYDRETRALLKKLCHADSHCIDVGSYHGEILGLMIRFAPQGKHTAFEPLPDEYQFLKKEFGHRAEIFPYALSNENGRTPFHHVRSNPTYSGFRQRQYTGQEQIEIIEVETRKLDDVADPGRKIRLIKIDVEGAELQVLQGGEQLLKRDKPLLIFEHGLGAADRYNTTPAMIHDLLCTDLGYKIVLMEDYLRQEKQTGFSKVAFENQYHQQKNCYFLAVPADAG